MIYFYCRTSGVRGTIKVNDSDDKTRIDAYKKDCCYILQDDQLLPLFSVAEIMMIAANLKLGYGVSAKSKELIVSFTQILIYYY